MLMLSLAACANEPLDIKSFPILPKREQEWCSPPVVVKCKDLDMTIEEVESAFAYFPGEIKKVVERRCSTSCEAIPGTIYLDNVRCFKKRFEEDETVIAGSRVQPMPFRKCYGAGRIEFQKNDARIAAHEAAHVLGWGHCSTPGHLMYPVYEDGGWSLIGMKEEENEL
jgi:hypothetical protein